MTLQNFKNLKAKAQLFRYNVIGSAVYERIWMYTVLQCNAEGVLLVGENKDTGIHELCYAVSDFGVLIDSVKSLPYSTVVSFIPEEQRQRFLDEGFSVYAEFCDYWLENLTVPTGTETGVADLRLIYDDEYEAASMITQSVRGQSRGFHEESVEWLKAWAGGLDAGAKESGAEDCGILVHKVGGVIAGIVCVGIYGREYPKGATVWIREIAVRPEYQNRGIGRKLLLQALAYGAGKGAVRAFLAADTSNTTAIGLYQAVGFSPGTEACQLDMIYNREKTTDIIKSHDITLFGGNDTYRIILKPLTDAHLPYLYKWCADPEVLYWTETGTDDTALSYGPESVHEIYGKTSQNAFCFLIEVNGEPIGECWLQKMNIPSVLAMYGDGTDVRRIDMTIGEKAYWNKGIGTIFIGMLIDFAFNAEHADVLHCFCDDYNFRSRRMWEKHGFTLALTVAYDQPSKGSYECHYTLTREQYLKKPL